MIRSIEERRKDYDSYFPIDNAFNILKDSLKHIGYDYENLQLQVFNREDHKQLQTGQTFDIDPPSDVRIAFNLWKDGVESYRILFHEFGHALHFKHIDPNLPYILRTNMPSHFTEGLAQVIEYLIFDDDWLQTFTALSPSERLDLRVTQAAYDLLRHRRDIAFAEFERLAYRDEPSNMDNLSSTINREILFPDADEGENLSDLNLRLHQFIDQPLSAVQTLLTVAIREHVRAFISKQAGKGFTNVRDLLVQFYRVGNLKEWDDLINEVTGEPLNMDYLGRYFSIVGNLS
ncbi:MAG: M3 family metallopeptidase [Thermoproteota archaeon]|nr:M3 family metallopeptidase [Thermoproteota archaeon]